MRFTWQNEVTHIIGHSNPSVRIIIDLVSYTTYAVCVNFIHKWRDLQFKVDSEWQIFWETFHGNFIYSQSFCQKSAERKSPKKYFLYFVLMSGLGQNKVIFFNMFVYNKHYDMLKETRLTQTRGLHYSIHFTSSQ